VVKASFLRVFVGSEDFNTIIFFEINSVNNVSIRRKKSVNNLVFLRKRSIFVPKNRNYAIYT